MISYDWYKIFDMQEFLDLELTSREMIVVLEGIGRTSVLVSRGNVVSLFYNGTFLPIDFLDKNPYVEGIYASYLDINNQVWLGIEVAA